MGGLHGLKIVYMGKKGTFVIETKHDNTMLLFYHRFESIVVMWTINVFAHKLWAKDQCSGEICHMFTLHMVNIIKTYDVELSESYNY